jgi:UDP-N-acetylglucosamine--N-acetylmuramyl-(pentapeptide) pyrophosphoryl-undecaprenol N-acetylglucosamine transferase
MKILLSGGGTMGSVSPLIALYLELRKYDPKLSCLFVGGKTGPEKVAVESYGIPFHTISSGRFRRYLTWQNILDPLNVAAGFFQSFWLLLRQRPDVVVIAGSFVGVPVAWAAWILRVPIIIHQQDIIAGLANKLMANFARKITLSFEISKKDFSSKKTVLTGNPVKAELYQCYADAGTLFGLDPEMPTVLIMGGGTGAQNINTLVEQSIKRLTQFCQILHISGKGKKIDVTHDHYHQFEFLTKEMTDALCASDLVVARAGISTLSELVVVAKPAIIIPIADSHQEANAHYFQNHNAVVKLDERGLTPDGFASMIEEVLYDKERCASLSKNISGIMQHNGALNMAQVVAEVVGARKLKISTKKV